MLYLLLICFPVSLAASCFILRKHTGLVTIVGIGVLLTQMFLVVQIPLDEPIRLLGVTLMLSELKRLFLLVFLSIGVLSFFAAWHLPHGENFVPVTLLILMLVCAIFLLQDPFIISLLLVGAGVAAVLAIVDLPPGAGVLVSTRVLVAALRYLLLMVVAGVVMYLGFVLAQLYQPGIVPGRNLLARLVLALLAVGFALRLALIPFHIWLPDLVEMASPLVSALVVAVINTTSLVVLIFSFQQIPGMVIDNPAGITLLRLGGIATCVLAGVMSLDQPGMRRTSGYLLIYNSGMIFYGLASVSVIGLTGAIFEAFNQAFAVVLLFISLALLERPDGRPPGVQRNDLLRRWPVAGAGFLGGGMMLLGVPPFGGFASKLLLYRAALEHGWVELVLLLLATVLAGVGMVRLAASRLLGPGEALPVEEPAFYDETEMERLPRRRLEPEPRGMALLAVLLLSLGLVSGLYPQPLLETMSGAIRGLTFVRL